MGFANERDTCGPGAGSFDRAVVAPIYQTSTYVYEELGKSRADTTMRERIIRPEALERTVAKLEGGHAAYVFTSGMAGIDAVSVCEAGDHVVLSEAVASRRFYRYQPNCWFILDWNFSFVEYDRPGGGAGRDATASESTNVISRPHKGTPRQIPPHPRGETHTPRVRPPASLPCAQPPSGSDDSFAHSRIAPRDFPKLLIHVM